MLGGCSPVPTPHRPYQFRTITFTTGPLAGVTGCEVKVGEASNGGYSYSLDAGLSHPWQVCFRNPPLQPIICLRTLIGVRRPRLVGLGTAGCCLLDMLTAALRVTSSHSKAYPVLPFHRRQIHCHHQPHRHVRHQHFSVVHRHVHLGRGGTVPGDPRSHLRGNTGVGL